VSTRKGQQAEERACRYLQRRGYAIVARNVRAASGEIDIVARRADMLVFAEVKSRANPDDALLAMHKDKTRRLKAAALAYLGCRPDLAALQCRFDFIILGPGRWFAHIEHMKDVLRYE